VRRAPDSTSYRIFDALNDVADAPAIGGRAQHRTAIAEARCLHRDLSDRGRSLTLDYYLASRADVAPGLRAAIKDMAAAAPRPPDPGDRARERSLPVHLHTTNPVAAGHPAAAIDAGWTRGRAVPPPMAAHLNQPPLSPGGGHDHTERTTG